MEFTNDTLQKMKDKQKYNEIYGNWYYGMSREYIEEIVTSKKYLNKGNRIKECLDYWLWDIYHKNKLMDLQKVNRCKNNRFCPNCKKWELAKFIHSYGHVFNRLILERYNPYLLTLTVPNVKGEDLRSEIDKMNECFNRFFKAFNQPIGKGKKGFKERLIKFDGALKVLEITYNAENNTYHPHFHCMIWSTDYNELNFKKNIQGAWSYKKNSFNMNSEMDIQIMKTWYMCYNKIRLSAKEYNNLSDNWFDLYMCDIREMDSHGIYEVLKYTFKDSDLKNYEVFKTIALALENKRIRQGYGLLRGLKCEDVEEGNELNLEDFLEIDKKENPVQTLIPGIKQLIKEYNEFKKISRRKNNYEEELNKLE